MLAALGVGLATTVLSALRWRLVAQRVGLTLPLGDAIAETYRAIFLNAVLPGGVLGDVDRAVRHGRSSGDVARGARAVAIERTAGQLVLIVAALVVIPTEPALVLEIGRRLSRTPLIGFGLVVLRRWCWWRLAAGRRRSPARRTTEPGPVAPGARRHRGRRARRRAGPHRLAAAARCCPPPRWPATCCCS